MKVLHLLGAPEDTGGILTVLRNLSALGPVTGQEHVVWVHRRFRETRRPPLTLHRGRFLLDESPRHLELLARAVPAWFELARAVRRLRPDALHAHSRGALPVAMLWAGLARRPILFSSHAYARRTGLYQRAARLRHLRFSVLTPNMARHYGLTPGRDGVAVVSECCADAFFEKPLAGPPRAAGEGPVRLVGLGNIVRWKNWHLLLQAIALLPPEQRARLVFDHWGPVPDDAACRRHREELQHLAERAAPARVAFRGLTLNVEQPLREADWFVLPSTNEPCSVALIESLALGRPAIVSASGGNVDIVEDGRTGLHFQPDDAADLSRALRRLLAGEVRPLPPEAIRESVRPRSASAVAAQYGALYEEVRLKRPSPAGSSGT
ncbi:MAG: glycosyltransferase [Verrucomicrobia bacterium]|nr:MAG: glycosyltransferase [Verrucomicrobiota bacterium]